MAFSIDHDQRSISVRNMARPVVGLILLFGLCLQSFRCKADVESETILIKTGEFLVEALKDYLVHETINRGVGFLTKRKELNEVEKSLQESLNESERKSETEIAELRQELRAAQIQLNAFRQLEAPASLTKADANRLANQINGSLEKITATLRDHERRLQELERRMADMESKFSAERLPASRPPGSQLMLLPPSFNCAKASTRPERLICSSAILADADGRLGQAYRELLSFVNRSETYQLREEERSWIKWRDQQLATSCSYNDQIDLNCALRIWQERTRQLRERVRVVMARARSQ